MTVFILIEEYEQDAYKNKRGDKASQFSSIIGVYADREKAEKEKTNFEEFSRNNNNVSCSYLIEERPVL